MCLACEIAQTGLTLKKDIHETAFLAVVGHTSATGKTSLMRTLLRGSRFGEVKNAAATTRHVEEAAINGNNRKHYGCITTPPAWKMPAACSTGSKPTRQRVQTASSACSSVFSPAPPPEAISTKNKVLRQLLQTIWRFTWWTRASRCSINIKTSSPCFRGASR